MKLLCIYNKNTGGFSFTVGKEYQSESTQPYRQSDGVIIIFIKDDNDVVSWQPFSNFKTL